MKELEKATRQYQHNDCSGLVIGYDRAETEKAVMELKMLAHNEISTRLDAERNLINLREQNEKLQAEIKRLNSVLKNRKVIAQKWI